MNNGNYLLYLQEEFFTLPKVILLHLISQVTRTTGLAKEKAVDFLERLGYIYNRFCSILYIKREQAVCAFLRVFPGTKDMVATVFFAGKVTEAIIS
jgi:hypothetical protein